MSESAKEMLKDLERIGVSNPALERVADFIYSRINSNRIEMESALLKGEERRAIVLAGNSAGLSEVEREIKRIISVIKKKEV